MTGESAPGSGITAKLSHSQATTSISPALGSRTIGARTFDFAHEPVIMAIVNRTPDSFYDGGTTYGLERAVDKAAAAIEAGAQWVDIGGVPFSPDTPDVSVAEELDRVIPVIKGIRSRTDAVVSVDTYQLEVAEAAIAAGANVINDVTGLLTPGMPELIARTGAHVVIAHSIGMPHRHLRHPTYGDVVTEVGEFLIERIDRALAAGVKPEQIIVDPGHDLNKNTQHTLEITQNLGAFATMGYPLLVALSNKDFIGESLDRPKSERLPGSLAAAVWCYLQGARIFRVHEVGATIDALRMIQAIQGNREPAYLRHNVD